jgi:threonine/homoserine/homoserine lactone efflux protein
MSLELLLAFVAACILLGLTPGPNMAVTMANTLSGGLRGGLVTLAGTTTGLAVLVSVAAAGMTSVMVFMSTWFDVIRSCRSSSIRAWTPRRSSLCSLHCSWPCCWPWTSP